MNVQSRKEALLWQAMGDELPPSGRSQLPITVVDELHSAVEVTLPV